MRTASRWQDSWARIGPRRPGRSLAPALLAAWVGLAAPAWAQDGDDEAAAAPPTGVRPGGGLQGDRPAQPGVVGSRTVQPGPDEIVIQPVAEPIQLRTLLVDYAVRVLDLNMTIDPTLQGEVAINAPVVIRKDKLLSWLAALLDQRGFALTFDAATQQHMVVPVAAVRPGVPGPMGTTRVIPTPNVRPSAVATLLQTHFGGAGDQLRVSYVDELGCIIATDTPRRLDAFEALVAELLGQRDDTTLVELPLTHIAASAARQRLLELVGSSAAGNPLDIAARQAQQMAEQSSSGVPATARIGSLENLADRLIVGPTGNSLLFRGRADEVERLASLLELADKPDVLDARRYYTGSATRSITDMATRSGLGSVIRLESAGAGPGVSDLGVVPGSALSADRSPAGGSRMAADEGAGYVVYYGTPEQHARFAALVAEFKVADELPRAEVYRLRYGKAEEIAEIIDALLSGQQQVGESPLLGGGDRSNRGRSAGLLRADREAEARAADPAGTGQPETPAGDENTFNPGSDVFVVADEPNNQIIVHAPGRQQAEFRRLIERLDLRRPQVFLKAQIVAITASEDFRLAFEEQINSGQFAFNTSFGLSSLAAGAALNSPKLAATGLAGATTALIKSEYVPFIINALQTNADGRVLSSPQVLVDDNSDAFIKSTDKQPFSEVTVVDQNTVQGQGGVAEAGTTLEVTPRISETGGFVTVDFRAILSSFTGEATAGLEPPSQENELSLSSVLVPSGATIILGGLNFETARNTITKVPLLGDLPLFGHLFRDTREGTDTTTLYVFLTPQIIRDPNFNDLLMLTRGPQAESGIDPDMPELMPAYIQILPPPPTGGS